MKKNKVNISYPEKLKMAAVNAVSMGKSAQDASSIACKNVKWKGQRPSASAVRRWYAASERLTLGGLSVGEVARPSRGTGMTSRKNYKKSEGPPKIYYPKGFRRDLVSSYKSGASIEDAIEVACEEWQHSSKPSIGRAKDWLEQAGVKLREELYTEEIRLDSIRFYRESGKAVDAARKACEQARWPGEPPSVRTVMGWVWEDEAERRRESPSTPRGKEVQRGPRGNKGPILDWVLAAGGTAKDAAAIAAWSPEASRNALVEGSRVTVRTREVEADQAEPEQLPDTTKRARDLERAIAPRRKSRRTKKQMIDSLEKNLDKLKDSFHISSLINAVSDGRVYESNKKEYRKLVRQLKAVTVAQSEFGASDLETGRKAADSLMVKIRSRLESLIKSDGDSIAGLDVNAESLKVTNKIFVYPKKFKAQVVNAYSSGLTALGAAEIVLSQSDWVSINKPNKTTIIEWIREAGVPVRSHRYPQEFKDKAVKAYMDGAPAPEAGRIACKRTGYSGPPPSHQGVLGWVVASGNSVRSNRRNK